MLLDLKNTPQIFQRRMDNIFKDLNNCCLVYIDDVLVFSKTTEQYKDVVLVVTQRYIDYGIILGKNELFIPNKKLSS